MQLFAQNQRLRSTKTFPVFFVYAAQILTDEKKLDFQRKQSEIERSRRLAAVLRRLTGAVLFAVSRYGSFEDPFFEKSGSGYTVSRARQQFSRNQPSSAGTKRRTGVFFFMSP